LGAFQNLVKLIRPVIPGAGRPSEWPFVPGHYRICTRSAPVVVVVPRHGTFATDLAARSPEGLCMIAELASSKDVGKLLRNIGSNLAIEYVVLANGASDKQRLLTATHKLLDDKTRAELPKDMEAAVHGLRNDIADELDALRKQVKTIDLSSVGDPQDLQSRIKEITSDAKRQTTGFVAPESGESEEIERVIAVSGVRSRKSGPQREAYNRLSLAVRTILERWRQASGSAAITLAAAAAEPEAPEAILQLLAEHDEPGFPAGFLAGRFRQFMTESTEVIPEASRALESRDLSRFGELVDRSQRAAEEGLGNQVPETVHLARRARALGARAASAFGAGFGGSVWAMVDAAAADRFGKEWIGEYRRAFPGAARRADCFRTEPAPAARRID